MTDISITAANVQTTGNSNIKHGRAGATITAGQVVFLNSSSEYVLADADDTSLDAVGGIALNGAADGQPLAVCSGGDLTLGAVMTAGLPYFLSAAAGGIAPYADLGSDDAVIQIGMAKSTSVLNVRINDSGVILS